MKRLYVQILSTILANGYFKGFLIGKIYKGSSKSICFPGLNCYSCPGAIASCPIGSIQSILGSIKYKMSYYMIGILMLFGTIFGRFICGWLCPFGLVQDLMYKLSSKKLNLFAFLKYIKYVVLIYFVILFPVLFTNKIGMGTPAFCKYICPSGTLMGAIPLLSLNRGLRNAVGLLFSWKMFLLISILILSIVFYRIFCRVLCPLGAIYSFFNKVSLYRYEIDKKKCNRCRACENVCKMGIKPYEDVNNGECIRCGKCIDVCNTSAIRKIVFIETKRVVEIDCNYNTCRGSGK